MTAAAARSDRPGWWDTLLRVWIVLELATLLVIIAVALLSVVACAPSAGPPAAQDATEADAASADTGADAGANRLSAEEEVAGWRLLFDGATFDGWRGLGRDGIPSSHWIVEDGAIRKVASGQVPTAADGQPLEGGDIMTDATFQDFELSLEWRVAPGANSGIKYNVSEEMSVAAPPRYAALGFEYQILDDDLHEDAQNGPHRTAGALYDLMGPSPEKRLRPVGEYNHARLVFIGGHGEHWLNGVKVLEFDLDSVDFAGRLVASKYAPIEGFADRRAGHIVLQDHGDDVWFRNLKIRELSAPESHRARSP